MKTDKAVLKAFCVYYRNPGNGAEPINKWLQIIRSYHSFNERLHQFYGDIERWARKFGEKTGEFIHPDDINEMKATGFDRWIEQRLEKPNQ